MKTWPELEELAAADGLAISRTPMATTLFTTCAMQSPMLMIRAIDLDTSDADFVLRRTVLAALAALKELPR